MPGPLDGIRVVDLTSMVSGPLATMMLGDQGADVIKVENPDGGDHTRAGANRRGGMSASFLHNNRNKRSVVLDLKTEAGLSAILRIAATADVFVQNFRPGVAERIGIGEAAIRAVAPAIVYVSISGFGEVGPYAQKPVYDPLVQALSGLASVQAGSDEKRPQLVRTIVPDKLSGIVAAQAITRPRSSPARAPARASISACRCWRQSPLSSGPPTWAARPSSARTCRSRRPRASPTLIYDTADTPISVAVQSDRGVAGVDARPRQAGMAGGSALPHRRAAPAQHQRAARADPGGLA